VLPLPSVDLIEARDHRDFWRSRANYYYGQLQTVRELKDVVG
jgi:hypothetical protein